MGTPRIWGDLEVSDFIAVRSRIIEISKITHSQPTVSSMSATEHLEREKEKAKKAGERAEEFDPHSRVFRALDRLSLMKKAVAVILSIFATGAYYYLGIPENRVTDTISTIMNPLLALGILGVILYGGWCGYILSLQYNRNIVQDIIKRIKFDDEEIEAEESAKEVRAYYYWNKHLSNSATLSIILFLTTVRAFMPRIFEESTEVSKEWVPEYVDNRVSEHVVEEDSSVQRESVEEDTS